MSNSESFNLLHSSFNNADLNLLLRDCKGELIIGEHVFCMNCVAAQYCIEWTDEDEKSLTNVIETYTDIKETWTKKWESISETAGCMKSSRQCYRHSKNVHVIGYVSIAVGKKYKKFRNYARQLCDLGYVVVDKNACNIFKNCWPSKGDWSSFLQSEMIDNTSTKRFNALFSMKTETLDKRRRWWDIVASHGRQTKSQPPNWCPLELLSKRKRSNTIPNPLASVRKKSRDLSWIFDIDNTIMLNAKKNMNMINEHVYEASKNDEMLNGICCLEACNALTRSKGLEQHQSLHHDSLSNNAFLIEPQTNGYKILIAPHSHNFLYNGVCTNVPNSIPSDRLEVLTVLPNEVILCYSRVIHAGGKSSGDTLVRFNDLFELKEPVSHTLDDSIKRNGLEYMTDFAFQFAFIRSELTASSCHTGGKVGTVGDYRLVHRDGGDCPNKKYDEVLKSYDSALRTASKMYECFTLDHKARIISHICNRNTQRVSGRKNKNHKYV
jgi:hypothetical protein